MSLHLLRIVSLLLHRGFRVFASKDGVTPACERQ